MGFKRGSWKCYELIYPVLLNSLLYLSFFTNIIHFHCIYVEYIPSLMHFHPTCNNLEDLFFFSLPTCAQEFYFVLTLFWLCQCSNFDRLFSICFSYFRFKRIVLIFLFYFTEINQDENLTPEMPNFQSDEGRRLSTKKINPNKLLENKRGKRSI